VPVVVTVDFVAAGILDVIWDALTGDANPASLTLVFVVGFVGTAIFGSVVYLLEQRELSSERRIMVELAETVSRLDMEADQSEREVEESEEAQRLRAELARTRARLTELESTVPFERESNRTKWAARSNQLAGAGVCPDFG
jgi:hypothetical protein